MRLVTLNPLAIALLILSVSSASAYRLDVTSNYDGVSTLTHSDTVTITLAFDTEGAADVMLLATGVIFDTGVLAYDRAASSTNPFLLHSTARSAYLVAVGQCGNGVDATPGQGCALNGLHSDQVQVDFLSSGLLDGSGVPTAGADWLVHLVFHVIAPGDGFGDISITMDEIRSSIFMLGDLTKPPLAINQAPNARGVITNPEPTAVIPEPTAALLLGTGLLALWRDVGRRERTRRRAQK